MTSDIDLAKTTVTEIMRQWPQTVPVFVQFRMKCPGCLLAPFMTLAEAAAEHNVDLAPLRDEIVRTIEDSPRPREGERA